MRAVQKAWSRDVLGLPLRLPCAHLQDALRRPFHENDLVPVGSIVQRRHEAVLGAEGNFVESRPLGPDVAGMKPRLGGERDERTFHRIAIDGPCAAGPVHVRIVAQEAGAHEREDGGPPGVVVHLGGELQLAVGSVAGAGSARLAVCDDDALRRHLVAGERAGLVGADDRRGSQGLDRRQPAHDRVAGRHALHADGKRDRDDRRQSFGYDADGKSNDGDEGVRPGIVAHQDGEGEQEGGPAQRHPGELPAEVVDLPQQRRGELLHLAEQLADAADLRHGSGRDGNAGALSRHDQSARESHAAAVAERSVRRNGSFVLLRRHGLAGQNGLVDQKTACLDESEVGGNAIAGLDQHDVAGHDLRRRHADALAVPHDVGTGGDHVADGGERILGLALLHEADQGVHNHHDDDDGRVDEMAQAPRCNRTAEQEIDEGVVELRKEAQEGMAGRRRRKLVAAMALQAPGCLPRGQAFRPRYEMFEHLARTACVKRKCGRTHRSPIEIIHPADAHTLRF